jgi:hypothetical protein
MPLGKARSEVRGEAPVFAKASPRQVRLRQGFAPRIPQATPFLPHKRIFHLRVRLKHTPQPELAGPTLRFGKPMDMLSVNQEKYVHTVDSKMKIFGAEKGRTKIYGEAYYRYVAAMNLRRTPLSDKKIIFVLLR